MKPLISVIMPVAAAHVQWLPQALACFHAQTYEPKELIVSLDIDSPSVRLEGVRRTNMHSDVVSIGEIRNDLCRTARGEIIAHMDVDDWYAPDHLERLYEVLTADAARQVVAYRSCLFHDLNAGEAWHYRGRWSDCIGASLMYRRSWWEQNPFEPKRLGEDSAFANVAAAAGVYGSMLAHGLMVARRHGANTCKYKFVGDEWTPTPARYENLPAGYRATLEVQA